MAQKHGRKRSSRQRDREAPVLKVFHDRSPILRAAATAKWRSGFESFERSLYDDEQLNFVDLRLLVKATDGNLGAHLQKLEEAGYILVEKVFINKKPCTWVRATAEGGRAYEEHVRFLRKIVGE